MSIDFPRTKRMSVIASKCYNLTDKWGLRGPIKERARFNEKKVKHQFKIYLLITFFVSIPYFIIHVFPKCLTLGNPCTSVHTHAKQTNLTVWLIKHNNLTLQHLFILPMSNCLILPPQRQNTLKE